MKCFKVYFLDHEGRQSEGVECCLKGDTLTLTGSKKRVIENLHTDGVPGPEGTKLYPRDGVAFFEAAQKFFHTPYAAASEVSGQ